MPVQFSILPGLPPYGPMALPFPANGRRAHSEGLVVLFEPENSEPWTGNFQRGHTGLNKILPHPDRKHAIVIAGGYGYVVNPETRSMIRNVSWGIDYIEMLDGLEMVLFGNPIEFEALRADGFAWKSPRISWDGIKDINIHGNELTGEAYSPIDDKWHPFKLDLLTGTCKDSIYEAQMATAVRIVKK